MTAATPINNGQAAPLPPLRSDLQLQTTPSGSGARFALTVVDPIRGVYFRFDWPQSAVMLTWRETRTAGNIISRLRSSHQIDVTPEDIAEVAQFAATHQLTRFDPQGGWQRFAALKAASRHGWLKALAHNYLFFRIPLINPERGLQRLLPALSLVFRPMFWMLIATLAACGLYLASRQWNAVLSAIESAWRFEALVMFAMAALALKAVHELGHALTTAYYGCRVPSMGIAVMIGAPVLYTDTTDSWRLPRRGDRLRIVFAGVMAEAIVAALALLAWSFLPDGTWRHICFSLATTSVVLSLAVNLNPLMRFDGYFALSDYLEVPNLQQRAFELGQWRMREALFQIGEPPPEAFEPALQRTLILYAYLTWIYRFLLYLGIAAIVYVVAGKAIGIVLGAFEIAVFIASPAIHEVKTWWSLRDRIKRSRRAMATAAAATAAFLTVCSPILRTVEVPAVLTAANEQEIHVPFPAQITRVAVRSGDRVRAGQTLFEARSPDLEDRLRLAHLNARRIEIALRRMHAYDEERAQRIVLEREHTLAREKIASLTKERERLIITAPFDGTVGDHDRDLAPGDWVSDLTILARVLADGPARLKGFVSDAEWARLKAGGRGVFVPDEPTLATSDVTSRGVSPASDGLLAEPLLAEPNGGVIPAAELEGVWRLRDGWVEVAYQSDAQAPPQLTRGVVRADADPISPLMIVWKHVARVFVREQNF